METTNYTNLTNIDIVREVLNEAAMTEEEKLLRSYRITPETKLPPMQPLFKMFGTPCFYRGELVAACGKAKSGKTLFLSILMAAGLTEKVLALEREGHTDLTDNKSPAEIKEITEREVDQTTPNPSRSSSARLLPEGRKNSGGEIKTLRVLWIDTEQSQQSTQDIIVNRIIPLINKSVESEKSVFDLNSVVNNNLFAYNLRGLGYEKRREVVETAVRIVKPDLVIIDGIKDLITDINDAVQATQIMEHLMSLAQRGNCCIVNVLHQNKSEADRNMRGSIGTELTNKAFEVYECEYLNQRKMFCVNQTLSRRQRIGRELCYVLSKEGVPQQCEKPQEQPRDAMGRWVSAKPKSESLVKLFNEAMEGHTERKFAEVMAIALKKCGVADAPTYYDLLKEAEEQGIIRKSIHPDTKETWLILSDDSVLPF